jgi:hypothetical protein
MIRQNIHTIISVIDSHDAGVYEDGTHVCPCGFRSTAGDWEQHIADVIDAELAEQLELPDGVV